MFKYYKTIGNLINCKLATEEELIKACAQTKKELPVPKDTIIYNGIKITSTNINSKDFIFYILVDLENRVVEEK